VTQSIKSFDVVVADTSLFCRVEETLRWTGLIQLLDYFDKQLRIVMEVQRELDKHARHDFLGLRMLHNVPEKGRYLRRPADALSPALSVRVGQIASSWADAVDSTDPRKNYGEVATVLLADELEAVAVIDDGNGRKFARARHVTTFTTRDVAVEMALAGAISEDAGAALWARVFRTEHERRYFDAAMAVARTESA
jgi:hypothetical protein